MSNHRISGLADPTDADATVTRRYVASWFQGLIDEAQDDKKKVGCPLKLTWKIYTSKNHRFATIHG